MSVRRDGNAEHTDPAEAAYASGWLVKRIKNLAEGTQTWEIEYARVMEQMKRKHNL